MPSPRLADAMRIWDAASERVQRMLVMKQAASVPCAHNFVISADLKPLCYRVPSLFPSFKGS